MRIFQKLVKYIPIYIYLLGGQKYKLPYLAALILLTSMLDILGIGLILPFLSIVTKPSLGGEISKLGSLSNLFINLKHSQLIYFFGASFLVAFALKAYISAQASLYLARFSYEQDTRMRERLLTSYMHANYEYHLVTDRASILDSLVQNVTKYSQSLLAILRVTSELLISIMLGVLILYSSTLAFSLIVIALPIVLLTYLRATRGLAEESGRQASIANIGLMKVIQESIEGIKEIRILGIEMPFIKRLRASGLQAEQSALVQMRLQISPKYFLETSIIFIFVIAIIVSTFNGGDIVEFIPVFGVIALAVMRLLPSINVIMTSTHTIASSLSSVRQIYYVLTDVLDSSIEIRREKKLVSECKLFTSMTLDDVSFSYDKSRKKTLNKISIKVSKFESIGIVGKSGAGKTTLVDLMLGLLTPSQGAVLINDQPLSGAQNDWWRMVAYIPQSPFLLDDSIRRNIALGVDERHIDESKICDAIRVAQLEEYIDDLPNGWETIIGDRGIRLSGGQRQRIAIARALYFDRQVLIFDEATSALDLKTESEIIESMRILQGIKTMIIVAHRLSTLQYCDRIIEVGIP